MKKYLSILLLLWSSLSFANGLREGIALWGSYISFQTNQDSYSSGSISGETKSNNNVLEYKFGYLMNNGLYLGGIFSNFETTTNASTESRNIQGATVGYMQNGFFGMAHFFFLGKYKLSSGTEFSEPALFNINFDVGYCAMMNSNVFYGVQMAYRNLSFAKVTPSGGSTSSLTYKMSDFYPMFNLGIIF